MYTRSSSSIGAGIFLAAVGAVLKYAVTATVAGVDIATVGTILMIAGVAIAVIGLLDAAFFTARRETETTVYRDPDVVERERYLRH